MSSETPPIHPPPPARRAGGGVRGGGNFVYILPRVLPWAMMFNPVGVFLHPVRLLSYNRDRESPHGLSLPTPPGIRITKHGGSVTRSHEAGATPLFPVLRWASFRPRLAATPLPFRLPSASPIPGAGTFTPQATCHARHTRRAQLPEPALRAPVCWSGWLGPIGIMSDFIYSMRMSMPLSILFLSITILYNPPTFLRG